VFAVKVIFPSFNLIQIFKPSKLHPILYAWKFLFNQFFIHQLVHRESIFSYTNASIFQLKKVKNKQTSVILSSQSANNLK
jgi:hypothetical protein